jgi:hypothetical protein
MGRTWPKKLGDAYNQNPARKKTVVRRRCQASTHPTRGSSDSLPTSLILHLTPSFAICSDKAHITRQHDATCDTLPRTRADAAYRRWPWHPWTMKPAVARRSTVVATILCLHGQLVAAAMPPNERRALPPPSCPGVQPCQCTLSGHWTAL